VARVGEWNGAGSDFSRGGLTTAYRLVSAELPTACSKWADLVRSALAIGEPSQAPRTDKRKSGFDWAMKLRQEASRARIPGGQPITEAAPGMT